MTSPDLGVQPGTRPGSPNCKTPCEGPGQGSQRYRQVRAAAEGGHLLRPDKRHLQALVPGVPAPQDRPSNPLPQDRFSSGGPRLLGWPRATMRMLGRAHTAHRLQRSLHLRSPTEQGWHGVAKLEGHGTGPGRSLGAGQCSGDRSLCPSTGAPGSALPKHPASPRPRGPGAFSGLDRFRMEAAWERGPGLSRGRRCQEETRGPGSSLCPSQLLRSTTHSAPSHAGWLRQRGQGLRRRPPP